MTYSFRYFQWALGYQTTSKLDPQTGLQIEGLAIALHTRRTTLLVMQTISLKLPDEMLAQLEAEAKARGMTRSSLVRESLEKALSKESSGGAVSCYDRARDLAGAIKGLPEDLAGNPKYTEGFGR